MVSLTMGKMWGEKVEEIANLKAAKQELKEQLKEVKDELDILKQEISENRQSKDDAESKLDFISSEYQATLETTVMQEIIINELSQLKSDHEKEISSLKISLSSLQKSLDDALAALQISRNLEKDFRAEIKHGDQLRQQLEVEKEDLQEALSKKIADFDTLMRAKEHCDRHIAILVKEKDRVMNKNDPKPTQPSKIYESVVEEKVTSWGQVENLRLKALLEQEQKENEAKRIQIEKLQKENWNLLNRLRNKK
ncbi:hypothetical protein SteCoe_33830 [Stentor coeruleus]|uniref:Uncharacterized protein n=1 Tax=Stentor coeruleus TaxID=5963 RepID=A0A1R2AW34_9CILI|nr:hypothetical protein SteCoe_33830 [Stentor coeruleus]